MFFFKTKKEVPRTAFDKLEVALDRLGTLRHDYDAVAMHCRIKKLNERFGKKAIHPPYQFEKGKKYLWVLDGYSRNQKNGYNRLRHFYDIDLIELQDFQDAVRYPEEYPVTIVYLTDGHCKEIIIH